MTALLIFIAACVALGAATSVVTACVAVSLALRLRGVHLPSVEMDIKALWARRKKPKRAMGV